MTCEPISIKYIILCHMCPAAYTHTHTHTHIYSMYKKANINILKTS